MNSFPVEAMASLMPGLRMMAYSDRTGCEGSACCLQHLVEAAQ